MGDAEDDPVRLGGDGDGPVADSVPRTSRGAGWTAVSVASILTLNAVGFVALLPVPVVGQVSFVLLLPGVIVAILLLVWAGRQGFDAVGGVAVLVGLVLLASPLLAFGLWQLAPLVRSLGD